MLSLLSAANAFTLPIKPAASLVSRSRMQVPVMPPDERVVNLQMSVDVGTHGKWPTLCSVTARGAALVLLGLTMRGVPNVWRANAF